MEPQRMRKTYKSAPKPTPEQGRVRDRTRMLRCHISTAAIGERPEARRKCDVTVGSDRQEAELPESDEAMPKYGEGNAQLSRDVVPRRVGRACRASFRRVTSGETRGSPRLHGRSRYHCSAYPHVSAQGGARHENGVPALAKIGRIAVRWSRPIEGPPKSVAGSRGADGWYVCCACAEVPTRPPPATGRATGRDPGPEAFATTSNGERILYAGRNRTAERRRKTVQRRVSRRTKGRNRRRTAVPVLAKTHLKVKRQRADFHRETALAPAQRRDAIEHEAVRTATIPKDHHLAKSSSDAGWSQFSRILAAEAAEAAEATYAGRRVVAAPPAYTIQTRSGGGVIVAKGLSVRWHSCPDCGTALYRDMNAARNRERLGQRLRGELALAAS